MANFDSSLTGVEIENALVAINNLIKPENNGKIITVENGKLSAKPASHIHSEAVIEPLNVTQNGTYSAPSGVDGYSPITVNVSGGETRDSIVAINYTLSDKLSLLGNTVPYMVNGKLCGKVICEIQSRLNKDDVLIQFSSQIQNSESRLIICYVGSFTYGVNAKLQAFYDSSTNSVSLFDGFSTSGDNYMIIDFGEIPVLGSATDVEIENINSVVSGTNSLKLKKFGDYLLIYGYVTIGTVPRNSWYSLFDFVNFEVDVPQVMLRSIASNRMRDNQLTEQSVFVYLSSTYDSGSRLFFDGIYKTN